MSAANTVQIQAKPIYTTPGGFEVREFSHSQWRLYAECPRKFYFERILGWRRKGTAAIEFGHAVELAIREFYFQKCALDPVPMFVAHWESRAKDAAKLDWPEGQTWESMKIHGSGLMTVLGRDWKKYKPRDPQFFDYKRNKLRIRDNATGSDYATVPDFMDKDADGRYITDIKALSYLINSPLPGMAVLDMQLATQAAATGVSRVSLWNFCWKPKRLASATRDEILTECHGDAGLSIWVVRETNSLTIDEAGAFLQFENSKQLNEDFKRNKKLAPELAQESERIIATIKDRHKPQYVIQWLEGEMPREVALNAVREEMSVIPLIQAGYFPRRGGLRFPDNQCVWCSHRGLCMEELAGPRPEFTEVTNAELVPWDARAMEDLD